MTTDHRTEAERLMSAIDTRDWRDEHPYVDRRTNAANVHALLAIHDEVRGLRGALTSPDRGRPATESDDGTVRAPTDPPTPASASEAQDEALARTIFDAVDNFYRWDDLTEFGQQGWLRVARAAREHLAEVPHRCALSLAAHERAEKAEADVKRLHASLDDEEANADRLKAEVERANASEECWIRRASKAEAEVERLTRERDEWREKAFSQDASITRLKRDVERLTDERDTLSNDLADARSWEAEVERLTRERDEYKRYTRNYERIVYDNAHQVDADGNALVTVRADDARMAWLDFVPTVPEHKAAFDRLRRALDERGADDE